MADPNSLEPITSGTHPRHEQLTSSMQGTDPLAQPTHAFVSSSAPSRPIPGRPLRKQAAETLKRQWTFTDTVSSISLLTIHQTCAGALPVISEATVPKSSVLEEMKSASAEASCHTSLHLAHFFWLEQSYDLIFSLLKISRIDEMLLYHLCEVRSGFCHVRLYHQAIPFSDNTNSSDTAPVSFTDSYYFHADSCTVLWLFTHTPDSSGGLLITTRVLLSGAVSKEF